jgi:uncharacterized Zn finger protein/superfamily II DNA or RNA helicase
MNRPSYGRTWWGAQWLQALAEIDHDNRLPRGRSYAGRGAVLDLVVDGHRIRARVQGSRPQPYTVGIEVPPVAAADAARLAARLAEDPGLIARLLNRELDPAVLPVSKALGIAVFPRRWSDLKMHCSCPDSAVPCKHLAAVIYLLSREIDGDPFLVFRLRRIDLAALLAPDGAAAAVTPALPDGVLPVHAGDARPADDDDSVAAATLDFSTVPALGEALWRLLPRQPSFWPGGDWRELAGKALARIARTVRRQLDAGAPPADEAGELAGAPQWVVAADGTVTVHGLRLDGRAVDSVAALLDALAALPPERRADLSPACAQIDTARLLALHLIAQGAVVPQVYRAHGTTLGLVWCAAEIDPTVAGMVGQLAAGLPAGLVVPAAAAPAARSRRPRAAASPPAPAEADPAQAAPALAPRVQARALLAAVIDTLLRRVAADEGVAVATRREPVADKLLALFFGAGRASFDDPGEGAIAASVQQWLARLHLGRQALRPLLRIDEAGGEASNKASNKAGGEAGFALTVAVVDETRRDAVPTPLATVIADPAWAAQRLAVLKTVALLAEFHPPLDAHVRAGAREPLRVTPAALPALLFEALPALRLLGVRTVLPRALQRLWRPRLAMQVRAAGDGSDSSGLLDTGRLLSFDWQVAVGDARLTAEEFERLLGRAAGVVAFRGQYVMLDAAEVDALRKRLARPPALGDADLLRAALAGEHEGAPVGLDAAAQQRLEPLRQQAEVPPPRGLQATLRPYQQRGYAWLWRNARLGLGSVIADDMGLGKTLQVLALLLKLKEDGALADAPALAIVPTSLLTNWQKEAARFTPALRTAVYHGQRRELDDARPDLLLTTYGVARSEAARLAALRWQVLVLDEAQLIKNPAAAQTRAVKAVKAAVRIAMSGTPVENRLSEYWSIVDYAQRGHLGSLAHFTREYATPIQTHRDAAAAERLRRVIAPFVLRRLKSDRQIIDDLPAKLEQDQYCTLTPEQAALYQTVVGEGLAAIAGESRSFERQGLVLQMILALKQVCNHPAHYLKRGAADVAASGKAQRLVDLLDEIDAARGKALVFTQFREMGELLVQMLHARPAGRGGHAPLFLHGGVPRARRDEMVDRFQGDPAQRLLLLSLKAGGTGLNLTAANHVIHYDLWWNPAVEAQATDRAYRIGQQRAVQVHRFVTRGSFEERINDLIRSKRELAELTVASGETWIGQLPPQQLQALFALA